MAASKGSFRAGRLRAIQSKEDWVLWTSAATLRAQRGKQIKRIEHDKNIKYEQAFLDSYNEIVENGYNIAIL